jgi:hypothetical protein
VTDMSDAKAKQIKRRLIKSTLLLEHRRMADIKNVRWKGASTLTPVLLLPDGCDPGIEAYRPDIARRCQTVPNHKPLFAQRHLLRRPRLNRRAFHPLALVYPAAIAFVALTGSFRTLHSALRLESRGRTRSVSQK